MVIIPTAADRTAAAAASTNGARASRWAATVTPAAGPVTAILHWTLTPATTTAQTSTAAPPRPP